MEVDKWKSDATRVGGARKRVTLLAVDRANAALELAAQVSKPGRANESLRICFCYTELVTIKVFRSFMATASFDILNRIFQLYDVPPQRR